MKCEFCDNDASVFITQVQKDEELEMQLCESCAEERGIKDPAGFSLSNLLGGSEEKVELPELKVLPECSTCGFSFEDLKKVGRLGCPECYEVFTEEINMMLPSMHKGLEHLGWTPEGMFQSEQKQRELKKARKALENAIAAEDFEKAVALRDEIKKLEKEVSES